jgi:hypothetical protein
MRAIRGDGLLILFRKNVIGHLSAREIRGEQSGDGFENHICAGNVAGG